MISRSDMQAVEKIRSLNPFHQFPDAQFHAMLDHCEQTRIPAHKKLFKRGDADDLCYFLLEGSVNLVDGDFNTIAINTEEDDCRDPLDNQSVHQYSAVTKSECVILTASRSELEATPIEEIEADLSTEHVIVDAVDWMERLLDADVFQNIPPSNIQALLGAFYSQSYESGDCVVQQGQTGETFFVIKEGQAEVSILNDNGEWQTVASLNPGQFFGEEALIAETIRNATVTMKTPGVLMCLDKDSFQNLLSGPLFQEITASDLDSLRADGTLLQLLDVRLKAEYRHGHHPDSVHCPLNKLRDRLSEFDPEAHQIVVNNAGPRSVLATYLLQKAGFKTLLLELEE